MSGIVLTEVADATIPTPAAGKVTVYMSTEEAGPAFKDDAAAVTPLQGAAGGTGPGYGGTSTTSFAIGTGSKAFTTQAGRAYVAGSRVRAASNADPDADWMEGVASAYSGTTLTVLMDLTSGSGTHTDWNLSLAGERGETGPGVGGPMEVIKTYNSATQTILDNQTPSDALVFNSTEGSDPDGYKVGNTFVIPVGKGGCWFRLEGAVYSETTNAGSVSAPEADVIIGFRLNGTTVRGGAATRTQPSSTSNPGQPIGYFSGPGVPVELADGDEIEMFCYIDNDGQSMVFGHASEVSAQNWMAITRLMGAEGPAGVGTVTLTGDSGTATGIDDITFVGADVVDDGGGAATVTVTGSGGAVTATEVFLTGNVTMTNATTVYDGPTSTPAAGDYLVRGRLAVLVNTSGGAYVDGRLYYGATVVDEAPGFHVQYGNLSLPLFGIITADGATAIKLSAIANGAGNTILATSNSGNGTTNKASHLILEKIA